MDAYKKVCTHFVQPSAVPTFERLGVMKEIEAAGAIRGELVFRTRYGMIHSSIPEKPFSLRREKLDPMLRKLAAATPGVTLTLGASVTGVEKEGERVAGVRVKIGEADETTVRAQVVVAADGRNGKLGELAGVPSKKQENGRFLYFAYFTDLPVAEPRTSLLWFDDPDCAYMFPNDDGLWCIAVAATKDKLPAFKQNLEEAFLSTFDKLEGAPNVRKAKRTSDFLGMLEMPNFTRAVSAPGIAFIGDAALTSDPVWGIGAGWAVQTGEWLAEDIGDALANRRGVDAALATYRKHHGERLDGHHKMISDMSSGRRFNVIERALFRAIGKDQDLARGFERVGARIDLPEKFMTPKTLLKGFWVNATR